MARCPFEKLSDLQWLLKEIRSISELKEVKPGIFYFKTKGFLHFHIVGESRWADVRNGVTWGKAVQVPFGCSRAAQTKIFNEIRRRLAVSV